MREDRRAAVREHLESLVGLESLWDLTGDRWASNDRVFALAALAAAPYTHRPQTERCANAFVATQAADGTWDTQSTGRRWRRSTASDAGKASTCAGN